MEGRGLSSECERGRGCSPLDSRGVVMVGNVDFSGILGVVGNRGLGGCCSSRQGRGCGLCRRYCRGCGAEVSE